MDIRQLRCFCTVVERGTVTGGAAELRIAQSAVSRHIKALESEIGTPLLARSRHGMSPTDAGQALYERAKSVLGTLSQIKEEVASAGRIITGTVRFSIPASMASLVLPPLAKQMLRSFPLVRLSFSEDVTEPAVKLIRSDSLDVAVVTSLKKTDELVLRPLFDEPLCCVSMAANARAVMPSGMLTGTLIMPRDAGWRRSVSLDTSSSIIEVDSVQSMIPMVRAGLGSALMPQVATRQIRSSEFRVVPLSGIRMRRALAWSARRPRTRAVDAFLKICHPLIRDIVSAPAPSHRPRP